MASANTIELNESNFDQEVIKSTGTVLVDFWAEWCGPCKMIAPLLDQIAEEADGKVKIGKVDVDSNSALAGKYNIRAIPTLIIFKGGQQVEEVVGMISKAALEQKLGVAS